VLGSTATLSLVDKIHILAMVFIFIAALIAVFARKTYEAEKEELAKRRDRVWLRVLGISFVLANGLLISMAAITG
jgi:ascorbate-specific PTS system EIIC-type component UlaA